MKDTPPAPTAPAVTPTAPVFTAQSTSKPNPLSTKQRLLLVLFSLEVIFYPFIVGFKRGGDTSELTAAHLLSRENVFLKTWVGAMFIWVPIALVLGFMLGRRLWNHPGVVRFFRERDISPDEIPPIVGIFAPLSIIMTVLVIYGVVFCLALWFITIPLYLIIRFWKKKGIRHLLGWIVSLVGRIAIKLKRMSYVGYILPLLFGSVFARWLSRGKEETAGGTYALILLQMVVLIALWKNIRTQRTEPSPAVPPQMSPAQQPYYQQPPPQIFQPLQDSPRQPPLQQQPYSNQYPQGNNPQEQQPWPLYPPPEQPRFKEPYSKDK